jgi:hypothetical protein
MGEVLLAAFVGSLMVVAVVVVRRKAPQPPPELPNPLADSPAVSATLAVLGPDLAPDGPAGWLTVELGGARAAVEALVGSLQPGLPAEGPFEVNRLVAHAPVRLSGTVTGGAPTITSVLRLDVPSHG